MPFVTGLLLIDAPASALNNLGNIPGERNENTVGVKVIRSREGQFPYVSAQAFRYWLRMTIKARVPDWAPAPIHREEKVAYTDANPIRWWDDDLFGYMRAPSKKAGKDKPEVGVPTEIKEAVTRVSPFRVSTLVSIAPVTPTNDFGVMSRHEGDPVPHEHQFYRATLKGLFSLDLHACGTFSYRDKAGFRNLDEVRTAIAKAEGLEHLQGERAYRLAPRERVRRVQALFSGLAMLEGGAKQSLHYTDVAPPLVVMAVTKGGNHIFNHVIGANARGVPEFKTAALAEALQAAGDELLSPVHIGWTRGYLDEERARFEQFLNEDGAALAGRIKITHPREAYAAIISALEGPHGGEWLA